ncbi:MAG: thioredoxin family protein [Planctomycetota bacterium]|nr:thioredoxin family protein [Planctomycetota bacterium]
MMRWMAYGVVGVAAAVALGGCGYEGPGLEIRNPADLERVAIRNPKPTVVVFHKDGCSACAKLTPVIQALAKEYEGRVTFAKCMILDMFFNVTSYALKTRYEVEAMPTVSYNLADYRRVINRALGETGPASRPASEPAGEPATQPANEPAATQPDQIPPGDG